MRHIFKRKLCAAVLGEFLSEKRVPLFQRGDGMGAGFGSLLCVEAAGGGLELWIVGEQRFEQDRGQGTAAGAAPADKDDADGVGGRSLHVL